MRMGRTLVTTANQLKQSGMALNNRPLTWLSNQGSGIFQPAENFRVHFQQIESPIYKTDTQPNKFNLMEGLSPENCKTRMQPPT